MADDNKTFAEQIALNKALEKSNKLMESLKTSTAGVGAELFDLSTSDFFKEVERSPEQMEKLNKKIKETKDGLVETRDKMNQVFKQAVGDAGQINTYLENINSGDFEKLALKKSFEDAKTAAGGLEKINIADWMAKNGERAHEFVNEMIKTSPEIEKFKGFQDSIAATSVQLERQNEELKKNTISVFSLSSAFGAFVENKFSVQAITKAVLDFDDAINKGTRNTGIMFNKNSAAFTQLNISTAQFGRTAAENVELMGSLGDKLNTTNFDVLAKAAEDSKTFAYAIGLTNQESAELMYNFMRMGASSKQVSKFVEETANEAESLGLNAQKVVKEVSKLTPEFRRMGFQGGEKSLARMIESAEKLRLNVDEVFAMGNKARTIEGAMERAADLQLAGGSFAQLDPMQLLAAARKGPEELTKILAKMGNEIGTFNKETGRVDFGAIDADRLEMVSKATGLSVDSLMDKITKSKQDVQKENLMGSLFGQLDDEQKKFVQQFTDLGENGEITLSGALQGKTFDQLKKMNQGQIKQLMEDDKKKKKDLAARAKQNETFEESLKNFTTVLMNFFTLFEPLLTKLTWFIQTLTDWPKASLAALTIGFLMFKGIIHSDLFGGLKKNLIDKISNSKLMKRFGFGGGDKTPAAPNIKTSEGGKGFPGFMRNLRDGFAAWGTKKGTSAVEGAFKFGLAMAAAVVPLMLVAGVYKALGGSFTDLALLGLVLVELAGALYLTSLAMKEVDLVGIFKGALGMGILSLALVPFALVAQMFQKIDWETFGKMALAMVGGIAILAGIGYLLSGPGMLLLLEGAAGLVIAGVAIGVFGLGLLAGAAGFDAMSKVSWKGFDGMGAALMSLSAGLVAFGVSGLLLLNPLTLLGMATMVATLTGLSLIMSQLSPNLSVGAQAMNSMADGVTKLSTALASISTDTLDKLHAIGENVGDAAALTAAVNALNNAATGGGKGGTPQTFQIEVIVKSENGREMQRKIIKDTDLLK